MTIPLGAMTGENPTICQCWECHEIDRDARAVRLNKLRPFVVFSGPCSCCELGHQAFLIYREEHRCDVDSMLFEIAVDVVLDLRAQQEAKRRDQVDRQTRTQTWSQLYGFEAGPGDGYKPRDAQGPD